MLQRKVVDYSAVVLFVFIRMICAMVPHIDASKFLLEKLEYLRTSRPTAVNLFVATDSLAKLVQQITAEVQGDGEAGQKKLVLRFVEAAEKMLEDDISTNRAIGRHGAQRIIDLTALDKVTVLTICNTGSLATAGYGTALGNAYIRPP